MDHRPAIPDDTRQSSIPILTALPLHRDARGILTRVAATMVVSPHRWKNKEAADRGGPK